jgi:hypothetical protein
MSQFPRHLLLRSSWQTVNIGDIAHTPGMLALLETHLPQTRVTLWPDELSDEVRTMLRARFRKLHLAETPEAQQAAIEQCDFALHGSAPCLAGRGAMEQWRQTGKPYGIGGVTLRDDELDEHRDLLAGARFVFCRDTLSLAALDASRVTNAPTAFGPDATFVLDVRDDAKADAFGRGHDLEPKRFACFVPRLRFTPYWEEQAVPFSADEIARREAVNEQYRESDMSKLRAAIIAWVRHTGDRALLCPEMTYQVSRLRSLLFDPLPDDVKPHVVVRPTFWLTDEAASTYARAALVVSIELHSPIIAIANSTPAIHLRQPTDTRKGQMWRDVGLDHWLFEIDDSTGDQIAERVVELYDRADQTQSRVTSARTTVARHAAAMADAIRTA